MLCEGKKQRLCVHGTARGVQGSWCLGRGMKWGTRPDTTIRVFLAPA